MNGHPRPSPPNIAENCRRSKGAASRPARSAGCPRYAVALRGCGPAPRGRRVGSLGAAAGPAPPGPPGPPSRPGCPALRCGAAAVAAWPPDGGLSRGPSLRAGPLAARRSGPGSPPPARAAARGPFGPGSVVPGLPFARSARPAGVGGPCSAAGAPWPLFSPRAGPLTPAPWPLRGPGCGRWPRPRSSRPWAAGRPGGRLISAAAPGLRE